MERRVGPGCLGRAMLSSAVAAQLGILSYYILYQELSTMHC